MGLISLVKSACQNLRTHISHIFCTSGVFIRRRRESYANLGIILNMQYERHSPGTCWSGCAAVWATGSAAPGHAGPAQGRWGRWWSPAVRGRGAGPERGPGRGPGAGGTGAARPGRCWLARAWEEAPAYKAHNLLPRLQHTEKTAVK